MDEDTIDLIYRLFENKITDKEFINRVCQKESNLDNYIFKLLENSVNNKNAEDLEWVIFLIFKFKKFSEKFTDVLCEIFEDSWHHKHEDIASMLEEVKLPKTVKMLYKVAISNYPYLEFDDSYDLAVKCIWALGEIRNEEAIEKLKLLSISSNEIIKKNALEQLERIS